MVSGGSRNRLQAQAQATPLDSYSKILPRAESLKPTRSIVDRIATDMSRVVLFDKRGRLGRARLINYKQAERADGRGSR